MLRRFFIANKTRLARLTALAGVLVVVLSLSRGVPRTVDVELLLGPAHSNYVAVRIEYLHAGEGLHGVELSFPSGAPEYVHHSVTLPAGDFEVHAEARTSDGRLVSSVEKLHAPVQGTVLIHVAEPAR